MTQSSYFSNPSLDHGVAGMGAGIASTIAMQPLDLIKQWLEGHVARRYYQYYRYTGVKNRLHSSHPARNLGPLEHLYAASEAGSIIAITTNPLWLIKTRIFSTKQHDKGAYRGLAHGLIEIGRKEGMRGYWKGTLLALFGVLQGAIQFAVYEELKIWRSKSSGNLSNTPTWLSNWEYTLMSGASKLFALGTTYPYQVVRTRIQATLNLYYLKRQLGYFGSKRFCFNCPMSSNTLEKRQSSLPPVINILNKDSSKPSGLKALYCHPLLQVSIVGLICFCGPGLFNALTGLGGGGQASPEVANKANAALYATFATVAWFGGSVVNLIGPILAMMIGSAGYCLYIGSFLALNYHPDAGGFNIAAGAILGCCAGLLWTAQGSLMLSYPTEDKKGLYTSIFWVIFNFGGVIGSAVSVGTNWDSEQGGVTNSTYIAFVAVTALGVLLPLTLRAPSKMIREDGSAVVIERATTWKTELINLYRALVDDPWITLLFPFFFASNWFYTYQFNDFNAALHNVRTRSLNGLCYWLAQIVGAVIFGQLLDISRVNRKWRATIGWCVLFAMVWATNAGFYTIQRQFFDTPTDQIDTIDLTSSRYPHRIVLYIFAGALDAAWQTYAYWMMGSMSNDPSKLAFYAGFYKGLQSAGAAIIWACDSQMGSLGALASSWALMAGGLLLALPMVWWRIKNHTTLADETMVRDVEDVDEHARPHELACLTLSFIQLTRMSIDIVCCTNWELTAYHVPLIVAKYKGYFKDENLRVATIHPEDVSDVTEIVGSGKADLGLKAMIHTLAGKARGYPIKSIGTLMDEPFTGLLYLKGNGVTNDFTSLKGKKIGYVGEFGKVQVAELAQAHGMRDDEYEAVRCGMNISKALIDGKIHAGIGLENMQQVEYTVHKKLEEWCKSVNRPATDVQMLRIDQLAELGCCCFCSILYIGNEAWLEAHPNEARGFMKAVKRAADDLIRDPKGTWELFQELKPAMRSTLASLQFARSFNYMRSDLANVDRDWRKVTGYSQRLGIFPEELQPNYTNEYLSWKLDDEEKVDGNAKQAEMIKKQAQVAQNGGVLVEAA
ncbi:hypothetical protein E3P97_02580 [Wallemia ichthyophaga]|nr:hypothetical protein E3P97_02580 [Wallemia ichthyophaga]